MIATWVLIQALMVAGPSGWQWEFKTVAGPYYEAAHCQSHADFINQVTSNTGYVMCFQIS